MDAFSMQKFALPRSPGEWERGPGKRFPQTVLTLSREEMFSRSDHAYILYIKATCDLQADPHIHTTFPKKWS